MAAAGCSKADPSQASSPAPTISLGTETAVIGRSRDSALVEAGRAAARVLSMSETLWRGFSPEALLIYWYHEPSAAVLVTRQAPPSDFVLVVKSEGARPGVYFRKGRLRGLAGNLELRYAIGDIHATAIELNWQVAGTIDFAFHEAFHEFQQEAFATARRGDPWVPDSAVANAEYLALRNVETLLLAAALGSERGAERAATLQQYFAVRNERLALVPPVVAFAERHWETIEGSALWVGLSAASLFAVDREAPVSERLTKELERDPTRDLGGGLSQHIVRLRSRDTGAGIIALLNEMKLPWRAAVESGAPLDSLLAHSIPVSASPESELRSAARRRVRYDTLLANAQRVIDSLPAETLRADFESLPGFRLVLDAGGEPDGSRVKYPSSTASSVRRPVDPRTTIHHPAAVFTVDERGYLLVAHEAPVMTELTNPTGHRITIVLKERPWLTRQPGPGPGPIRIKTPQLHLEVSSARIVQHHDNLLHLSVEWGDSQR